MQDRHDQRGFARTRQAKNVVVFAAGHPQRGKEFAHVLKRAFAGGKPGYALFQLSDIAAHLRRAPLPARVADDAA